MSPQTQKTLENFATNIHWGVLGHREDLERFWEFVISAYLNNDEISMDEFMDAVDSFAESESDDPKFLKKRLNFLVFMFTKYEDGMKILNKYEKHLSKK